MYCSSCGDLLPAGRTVCARCHPGQSAPAFAAAPAAVHPACHAIAVLVGINLAIGLCNLYQTINLLLSYPQTRNARASLLMIPVSFSTYLLFSALLLLVTAACVVGLYKRNRTAWGALLGLKAIFLPFSLYHLLSFIMMLMGSFSGSMNLSNNSLIPMLIYMVPICLAPLLDAGVIFLLLKSKNNLVR